MKFSSKPTRAALAAGLAVAMLPGAFGQSVKPTELPADATQSPYQGSVVEDIVARVNDQVISKSDFARAEQDLDAQAKQQQWTQQQLFEQRRELLRDLIDQQLLISKGKELDINGETELVKRLDEMRKQNHLDSIDDLQKAAEAQGVSWEDFKASIRNRIITQEVIRDEVGRHVNVTPSEVQKYYDDHQQEFEQPEKEKLSEIMVTTANPDDAAQVEAAKKKADDLYSQLKSGADFAALAKSSSGGPTAAQGGDLGEWEKGKLGKVFEDQTFNLQAGQFTEPIRTKQGFVILKVDKHTPGGVAPLKDVEAQVEDAVGMAKMNPALRDYLTKAREDAYIEIRNGYEDSGASPNEMRPVYSAYQPPTPKKKKKVQRTRFRGVKRGSAGPSTTETAQSAPAPSVPSLASVPQGAAPAAAASTTSTSAPAAEPTGKTRLASKSKTTTQKAGKKEKIRFGQAPRETLPSAETKTEDASPQDAAGEQVAASNAPSDLRTLNPDGTPATPDAQAAPKEKKRFQDRLKQPKQKKDKNKVDPFAPAPETTDETADRSQQTKALGLNGDTSKAKKVNPAKLGPKRRMTDQPKDNSTTPDNQQQPAPAPSSSGPSTDNGTPTAPAPASPTSNN
ncbi:peptidylprolyl isomerase [Silvibacterium acidisoli]|uniref:peptidylprolyl isomerase n=1 Tax=Acidobacteriaceae bacterium ZG23-2 TaxID=2883246 RepID=UPI00406C63B9